MIQASRERQRPTRREMFLISEARWSAALPVMRDRVGCFRRGRDERNSFDESNRQTQCRRCRCNEETCMDDGLAERTIRLAVTKRRFGRCRGMRRGRAAAKTLQLVDMCLGDIGLKGEGEDGDEHDEAPRRIPATDSRRFRCRSRHESAITRISQAYAASSLVPQPDGPLRIIVNRPATPNDRPAWCGRPDLNRHKPLGTTDFGSFRYFTKVLNLNTKICCCGHNVLGRALIGSLQ
jgi:hypothetical protein